MNCDQTVLVEEKIMEVTGLQNPDVTTKSNHIPINEIRSTGHISRARAVVITMILVFMNFLYYIDSSMLTGILKLVQDYFHASDKEAGLLYTIYLCGVIVFAPVFGYLGDRFSRKLLITFGIILWSTMTFVGSLMKKDQFWIFFATRGLVGIGQASFCTLYPPIISDLFVGDTRSTAITVLNAVIPLGMGGGVMLSAVIADAFGGWQWALRATPPFGLLCAFLCLCIIKEPSRGAAESHIINKDPGDVLRKKSSYLEDLSCLLRVRSYVLSTLGSGCYFFASGSITFWGPVYFYYGANLAGKHLSEADTSEIIGIAMIIAGFVGVTFGGIVAKWYRRYNPSGDALVNAWIGIIIGPCMFLALWLADKQIPVSWTLVIVVMILALASYVPAMDLILYVVVPTRRASALAVNNAVSHVFGDALTPVITGAISDAIRGSDSSMRMEQQALMFANFVPIFFYVIGSALYFWCSWYVPGDRHRAEAITNDAASLIEDFGNDKESSERSAKCNDSNESKRLLPVRHRSHSYSGGKELIA